MGRAAWTLHRHAVRPAVRFATDNRVTVTDPNERYYGEEGTVDDYDFGGVAGERRYWVELDEVRTMQAFTVDQLDFAEEEKTT